MKLGTGTTLIEVAQTLGYYANPIQLSKLVNHPSLNKWSRVKPVAYAGESKATVEQLEQWMDNIGWGITMDSVGPMNTDEQMYGSAITVSQGECWHYTGMTPTQDYPARLGDFRHYNTDAECPYLPVELNYYVPGVEMHYGPVIELRWARNQSANAEINPYLKSTLHGNYYIVYRKVGTTLGYSAATTPVTESFSSLTSSRIQLTSAQTGDYEACALIRRGGGEGELYPLPETHMFFTVKNQTEEEYAGISLTNQCSMTKSSTIGHLYVRLKVRNTTNSAITAVVGCIVTDNRNSVLWQKFNHRVSVPANSSVTLYGNENQAFQTTDPGYIRIEDLGPTGDFRPPIAAECRAKNSIKGDVEMKKTTTILDS